MIRQNLVSLVNSQSDDETGDVNHFAVVNDPFVTKLGICPCCADTLLRHINRNGVYNLCRRCRQDMPDLQSIRIQHYSR